MAFQTEPVSQQIQQIQSETRVQGWLETASRYVAVLIAAVVLFVFWKMLKKQSIEPVPMELLAEPPDATKRALQTNGALSPELLDRIDSPEAGEYRHRAARLGRGEEELTLLVP